MTVNQIIYADSKYPEITLDDYPPDKCASPFVCVQTSINEVESKIFLKRDAATLEVWAAKYRKLAENLDRLAATIEPEERECSTSE